MRILRPTACGPGGAGAVVEGVGERGGFDKGDLNKLEYQLNDEIKTKGSVPLGTI